MIQLLSDALQSKMSGIDYIEKSFGVLRTSKDFIDGKTVTFPVDTGTTGADACTASKAVIPDGSTKSLAYYESTTGRIEISEHLERKIFKTLLNFVYWCAPHKMNPSDSLFCDKVAQLEWTRHHTLHGDDGIVKIHEVRPISIETDPMKVFSRYNYRAKNFMFENLPYQCFMIQMEVKFSTYCTPVTVEEVC